jgi:hypothetical protein
MKILSFDIGIKNLSYCYFDYNEIYKTYKIILWDVVTLLNEEQQICNKEFCVKKIAKNCKNKATYNIYNNISCKKHLGDYIIAPKEYINIIKKKFISQKILKQICNEFTLPKDKNIDDIIDIIKQKYAIPTNKIKSANDICLINIGINLKKKLDVVFVNEDIDIILIENQISTLATRMKTLQGMLAQYFINNNKINIKFISSKNKLKNYNVEKKTYNERKKSSIKITDNILNENKDITLFKSFFETNKKKDDLADCFLQGLWFINELPIQ